MNNEIEFKVEIEVIIVTVSLRISSIVFEKKQVRSERRKTAAVN